MAKQALDKFTIAKKDSDGAEQALLTALLRSAFPSYESYEDVPWTDLETGKAILTYSVAPMCAAVARRIRFIASKPTYSTTLCWAGYETEPDFHHVHLFQLVFKRLIRKKVDYDTPQLELLVRATFGSIGRMPKVTVLGHVERSVAKQGLKPALRRALTTASKGWLEEKVRARVAAVLEGKAPVTAKPKKALFRKPDPWAAKADQDVKESNKKTAWKELLQHCNALKTARPSQSWMRQSKNLVDQVGETHFVDRMLVWLGKVPQYADKDRQGVRSAKSYEAGNATLLRGLVWSLPERCLQVAPPLHKAALGCAKKVPDLGPRSTVVANACYAKLGQLGHDEALRLLFDLRHKTNYNTLVRGIDRSIASIAEARKSTVKTLEKAVDTKDAREAQAANDALPEPTDLLSAIYQNPREDSLRAVYADALSEKGDPQGEFIVLQLLESPTKEQRKRETALYKKHRATWLGPLQSAVRSGGLVFRGGFPSEARLVGDKHAELHELAGHPTWATYEIIDADGQYDRATSSVFFAQPVLRSNLQVLTGLHIENLVMIATDQSPWALTRLGVSTHTNAEQVSSQQRNALGAAETLPLVKGFVIAPGYDQPGDWQWLLDSKLGQGLTHLEVIGAETAWLRVATALMERMDEVLLRPHPFFGGCKYLFERVGQKVSLTVKVSGGEKYHLEYLEETFKELVNAGLSTLQLSVPKGPGRTKASLKRLSKLCDAMKLDSYRLPKA